jgi:luciferase family oxidoreductase group 1
MMSLPVSVLDLSLIDAGSTSAQALRNTITLGQEAERLGFQRIWLAEHHNSPGIASSTPEVMIGQVARATTSIHVGYGGVMLPNHVPLKVAETFRVHEALFPGRIDLGIGRAPGTDTLTALALRRDPQTLNADDYPQQILELLAFDDGSFPPEHPFRQIKAVPADVRLPPVWLLGSSDFSSQLSAELGLGFAFAAHINATAAVPAMRLYRERFKPSSRRATPHAILTVAVAVGEDDAHAEYLAKTLELSFLILRTGRSAPAVSPDEAMAYPYTEAERQFAAGFRQMHIVGGPERVKAHLDQLIAETQADELMVTTMVYSHDERVRVLERVAKMYDLQPSEATVPATAAGA